MKKSDVPQDRHLSDTGHMLTYAVNDDGQYVGVPSAGWEAMNTANSIAVHEIEREADEILKQVKKGRASMLSYRMVMQRMDIGLLAEYAGLSVRKVRKHMRPEVFSSLDDRIVAVYAAALGLDVSDLRVTPE